MDLHKSREHGRVSAQAWQGNFRFREDLAQRLDLQANLAGHAGCVNRLAWSRDGAYLASGSDDHTVLLWSYPAYDRRPLRIQTAHRHNIFGVAWLPGDRHIVTGAMDGMVQLHELEASPQRLTPAWRSGPNRVQQGQQQRLPCHTTEFRVHQGRVKAVATAPDEAHLFWSCSEDGSVRQFDSRVPTSSQEGVRGLVSLRSEGRATPIKSLAVNQVRSHQMAVAAGDASVRIFDRRRLSAGQEQSGTERAPAGQVLKMTPPHFYAGDGWRKSATHVSFGNQGTKLVATYHADQVYAYSTLDGEVQPRQGYAAWCRRQVASSAADDSAADDSAGPARSRARRDREAACSFSPQSPSSRPRPVNGGRSARLGYQDFGDVLERAKQAFCDGHYADAVRLFSQGLQEARQLAERSPHGSQDPTRPPSGSPLGPRSRKLPEAGQDPSSLHDRALACLAGRAAAYLYRAWCGDAWAALQDCEEVLAARPWERKCAKRRMDALHALGFSSAAYQAGLDYLHIFQDWGVDGSAATDHVAVKQALRTLKPSLPAEADYSDMPRRVRRRVGPPRANAAPQAASRPAAAPPSQTAAAAPSEPTLAATEELETASGLAVSAGQPADLERATDEASQSQPQTPAFRPVDPGREDRELCLAISWQPDEAAASQPGQQAGPRLPAALQPSPQTFLIPARHLLAQREGASEELNPSDAFRPGPEASESASSSSQASEAGGEVPQELMAALRDQAAAQGAGQSSSLRQPQHGSPSGNDSSEEASEEDDEDSLSEPGAPSDDGSEGHAGSFESGPDGPSERLGGVYGGDPFSEADRMGGARILQRYLGACNMQTDIKEACFLGSEDELVAAGSDAGYIFIWNAETGQVVTVLPGDEDVTNSLAPHPYFPVLASSGIEETVKLWEPRLGPGQGPLVDSKWIAQVTEQSQAAMKQRQPTQEEVLEAVLDDPALQDHMTQLFSLAGRGAPGPGELNCRTS